MDEIKPVMYQGTDIPELSGWKIDMDTGVVSSGRMWVMSCLSNRRYKIGY